MTSQNPLSAPGRFLRTGAIVAVITAVVFIAMAEIVLRVFFPQVTMFPRWESSAEYGLVLPRATTMLHRKPGAWEFRYTIDDDGCRGPRQPVARTRAAKNIVVLGDSYSMGMGVNDGQEYPAVLGQLLRDGYRVINTGTPGWGLTQEIRRYYEFGKQFDPTIVILQFCSNDPTDCIRDRVARVENGQFVFANTQHHDNPVFKILSQYSLVQSSQLYALVRAVYESRREDSERQISQKQIDEDSQIYDELLQVFSQDLRQHSVKFIVISVNGQLATFPAIDEKVKALNREGLLQYIEVEDWFRGITDYASPEGHLWGAKAHQIIGENLARIIQDSGRAR